MRELTVRIRFLTPCLGNQKLSDGSGRFIFQKSPEGNVIFLASWHHANMRLAAQLLNRFQEDVSKIHWDINVDAKLKKDKWYKNYYRSPKSIVPSSISNDDFWRLMNKAGQYKGISPWKPGEFGCFDVVSIHPRRTNKPEPAEELEEYPVPRPFYEK